MILKYYHLSWAVSLAAGFITCKKLAMRITEDYISVLLMVSLFLILSIAIVLTVYKRKSGLENASLKTVLIISIFIFYIIGNLSFGCFYIKQNNNLLKTFDSLSTDPDMEIITTGRVAEHARFYGNILSFHIKIDEISIRDRNSGMEKTIEVDEIIPARIRTDLPDILVRDDFIKFKCQFKNNQDSYYLYGYGTGIERISPDGVVENLYNLRSKTYNCIKNIFFGSLEYNAASLCEAVILGNTGNLSARTSSDFKRSGIYHLLAISGLHISFFILIISGFMKFIFTRTIPGNKQNTRTGFIGILLVILILIFFNFVVGSKASTIRSTLMSVYFLTAVWLGREIQRKTMLSFIFILILVIEPGFFIETGFWLTFMAVFAIVYVNILLIEIASIIKEKLFKIKKPDKFRTGNKQVHYKIDYIGSIFITTLSVNIFIFPILLYIFKEASLLSIITNVFAIPVFFVLLFILIIVFFSGLLWPPIGEILVMPSVFFIEVLFKISRIWRFFRFSLIKTVNFNEMHLIIYYVFLLAMLIMISKVLNSKTGERIHGRRFL